jgi:phosphopentomutase
LPNLQLLGLGSALELTGVPPAEAPVLHGRLHALGAGKDSTAGHWELMGLVAPERPPVYPNGFPEPVIGIVSDASGRGVLCNRPSNGLEAIEHFGAEALASDGVIVYTSQDSVLQIAAHVDTLTPEALYAICAEVRRRLPAEHSVGRVIARPFEGREEGFARTDGRRDFALTPPSPSYLDALQAAAVEVHAVGKVGQLFAGAGIDVQHPGATNARALEETGRLIDELETGFVFTNLIETDQVYGHRHDFEGFADALARIDAVVGTWLARLRAGDLLVFTADHGCDLTSRRTDHTREHVPLLARFDGHQGRWHYGPLSDVGASVLDWLAGREAPEMPGRSFL